MRLAWAVRWWSSGPTTVASMADRRADRGPARPRLAALRLPDVTQADPDDVLSGDDDLDGVEIVGLRCEELVWTGRRRLGESLVRDLVVTRWEAAGASLVESRLDTCEVVALSAPDSQWRSVELRQSRIGSAELYDAELRSVEFVGCKFGFLNLRGARLTDVSFTDCIIEGLDLMRATATRVAFEGSRIARAELTGSKLTDFDFRGARLADVGDPQGLRGATITLEQLLDLAPSMAARLGIRVE